ncbi:hypothetical protein CRUP_026813 [Coryphaenoides rupestris]|nr:hypothetical protein CRUP_026813 [Coryphaenoides rupestris]
MRALGGLAVVVVLLVRTHCDLRARDPGEEEEETEGGPRGAGGAGGWGQHLDHLLDEPETTLPPGPGSERPPETLPPHTGRMGPGTGALLQGSKANRKLSMDEDEDEWRCCPGHSGPTCEDSDSVEIDPAELSVNDPQLHYGNHDPGNPQLHHGNHDPGNPQLHHGNHDPGNPQLHHGNHDPGNPQLHHGNHDPGNPQLHNGEAALLVPAVAALVLARLNPILEGFNRSLVLLDWRVGELARDLAKWSSGGEEELGVQAASECPESRLEEVHRLLDSQRTAVEEQLHSQHVMLHYNLTSFKMEVDVKLKRTTKTMQTSLQGMNTTLEDLRSHQEQIAEDLAKNQAMLGDHSSTPLDPSPAQEPAWTIIKHLNTTTTSNLIKLSSLEEDVEENRQLVDDMQRSLHELKERIAQTGRDSQIQFMETGLEVEAAREVVLGRLKELEGNVSLVSQQTRVRDNDVDFLFTQLYHCTALRDEVAHLERGVTNLTELSNENRLAVERGVTKLTELANDNRLALEEGGAWRDHGDWESVVNGLQQSIKQLKDSLAAERGRGMEEEKRLLSSFNSLLNDVIRHSDVLQILLGEEALDFLKWTHPEKEAHSIPALKKQMRSHREELMRHNLSITALQRGRADLPMADQPQLPADGGVRRRSHAPRREQQLLIAPDPADGGGEGALEKEVEDLEARVQVLEKSGGEEEQLQQDVLWLRRAVEDHLRVFKKVFRQAETLEDSDRTLDLQDLWTLTQDSRRERRRGGERRRGDKDGERRRGDKDGEKHGEGPLVVTM